jgi:hypothetical protein
VRGRERQKKKKKKTENRKRCFLQLAIWGLARREATDKNSTQDIQNTTDLMNTNADGRRTVSTARANIETTKRAIQAHRARIGEHVQLKAIVPGTHRLCGRASEKGPAREGETAGKSHNEREEPGSHAWLGKSLFDDNKNLQSREGHAWINQ